MIYGYARVSTKKQIDGNSLESQRNLLKSFGAEKIFEDTFTGFSKSRPQLDELLSILQNGDTLIITKLDRIARSILHGKQIIQELKERGVEVHIIEFGGVLDDTPTGRLMLNMFFAIAEFERDLIMERTQIGKEIARTKNGYREGRPPKFTKTQLDYAMELLENHTYKEVAKMMRISERTLYREKAKRNSKTLSKEFKKMENTLTRMYNNLYEYLSNNKDVQNFLKYNNDSIGEMSKTTKNKGFCINNYCCDKDKYLTINVKVYEEDVNSIKLLLLQIPRPIRNKGIGTKIISIIENIAQEDGLHQFRIQCVDVNNKKVNKFYKKLGFQEDKNTCIDGAYNYFKIL